MKFLPFFLVTTTALVCIVNSAATAQTPAEINAIAKAVTVEINLVEDSSVGSGILIHRQGNLYTLITNRHVVCGEKRNCINPSPTETFKLKFGNGSSLQVPANGVNILSADLDLATIQFRNNTPYQTAQIAPSGSLKVGNRVYTSGYPLEPRGYSFNGGAAIAVVNKRLTDDRGGYTVVYNAETQPGMSGGGVFDKNGRLVAIHGQGERFRENTELDNVSASSSNSKYNEVDSKIGYNRGIPVRWVVQSLAQKNLRVGDQEPVTPAPVAINNTADEYFIAGFNKFVEPGEDMVAGKRQAIQSLTQAIRLNSRYKMAYFTRAIVYDQLGEYRLALADYNQLIKIDPNSESAYTNRGLLKNQRLNDTQGALADLNQAIKINPRHSNAYINRGTLKKEKLNDMQGALADFNQGLSSNPQDAFSYYIRGLLKHLKLKDSQGALADYDRAIVLNPLFGEVYNNRGLLKHLTLKDTQGALADYNQAIKLKPQNANSYFGRGYLKYNKLNDRAGGITDTQKAVELAKQQGNVQLLNVALRALQEWGVK